MNIYGKRELVSKTNMETRGTLTYNTLNNLTFKLHG